MSDNPRKKKLDRKRISLRQRHEVVYWTQRFNVGKTELTAAVRKVGPMSADVKRWLAVSNARKILTGLRRVLDDALRDLS